MSMMGAAAPVAPNFVIFVSSDGQAWLPADWARLPPDRLPFEATTKNPPAAEAQPGFIPVNNPGPALLPQGDDWLPVPALVPDGRLAAPLFQASGRLPIPLSLTAALSLHALVFAMFLVSFKAKPPPPPDEQMMSLVMESPPPGAAPTAPAAPPVVSPPLPLPPTLAPPAPAASPPRALQAELTSTTVRAIPQPALPNPPPPQPAPKMAATTPGSGIAKPTKQPSHLGITRPAKASREAMVFYGLYSASAPETGEVRLALQVLPDGSLGNVTVLRSSGFPVLDNVARNNVYSLHFKPAMKDGLPVTSTLNYSVRFLRPSG